MKANFDHHAINYDAYFSNSLIGKAQRERVHYFLNKQLEKKKKNLRVLEINCGTGIDADWLAKKGHFVIASDISSKMIEIAKNKYDHSNLIFKQLDLQTIHSEIFKEKFDLLFSNFGGLNCLSKQDLKEFLNNSKSILKPQGMLALVIMPKYCIWEQLYFFLKGDFKNMKRRNTNKALVTNVDGIQIPTWYYNYQELVNLLSEQYKIVSLNPIGIAIPPSYLNPFFKNKKILFEIIKWKEKLLKHRMWANLSDHYLIVFQKK